MLLLTECDPPSMEESGASCNVVVNGNKNKQNVMLCSPSDEDLTQIRKIPKLIAFHV